MSISGYLKWQLAFPWKEGVSFSTITSLYVQKCCLEIWCDLTWSKAMVKRMFKDFFQLGWFLSAYETTTEQSVLWIISRLITHKQWVICITYVVSSLHYDPCWLHMATLPYKLNNQPYEAQSVLKSYCCSDSEQHLIQKRFLRDDKWVVDFRLDDLGQWTSENKESRNAKKETNLSNWAPPKLCSGYSNFPLLSVQYS